MTPFTSPRVVVPTSPLSSAPNVSSPPAKRSCPSSDPSTSRSSSTSRTDSLSPASRRAVKRQRRRKSDYDKILEVKAAVRGVGWDIKRFLTELSKNRDKPRLRRWHRQYLDYVYTDFPQDKDFAEAAGPTLLSSLFDRWGWTWAADSLRSELKALAEHTTFGQFSPPREGTDIGSLGCIKEAIPSIKEIAPRWLELIEGSCRETQRRRPKPQGLGEEREPGEEQGPGEDEGLGEEPGLRDRPLNTRRTVIIFGTLCHLMRPNRSTNFQTVLGLYLYQGGARRRVLDTLCQLGLIMSYTTLQRRMEGLQAKAERKVQLVGQALSGVVTYDNFDFAEGKRGERAGDQRVFRSITTCLAIEGRAFDNGRLEQHMWHPHSSLLSIDRVAKGLEPSRKDWYVRLLHPLQPCGLELLM